MILPLSQMKTKQDKIIRIRELSYSLSRLDKEILILVDRLSLVQNEYDKKIKEKRELENKIKNDK